MTTTAENFENLIESKAADERSVERATAIARAGVPTDPDTQGTLQAAFDEGDDEGRDSIARAALAASREHEEATFDETSLVVPVPRSYEEVSGSPADADDPAADGSECPGAVEADVYALYAWEAEDTRSSSTATVNALNSDPDPTPTGERSADPTGSPSDVVRAAIGLFDQLKPYADRSNLALWQLLGYIYAESDAALPNTPLRLELENEARKHPDCQKSTRWNSSEQSAEQLFLTILLGLKDQRATKSQWLSTIQAAQVEGIARTAEAFLEFMRTAGGINGAVKTRPPAGFAPEPKIAKAKKLAEAHSAIVPPDDVEAVMPVAPPLEDGAKPYIDMALVLVDKLTEWPEDSSCLGRPVATIVNHDLVQRAIMQVKAQRERLYNEAHKEERQAKAAKRKSRWGMWRREKLSGKTSLVFDEWHQERYPVD